MLPDGLYLPYFHDVSDDDLIPEGIRISTRRFRETIRFLKANFELLPFKEAIAEQRRLLRSGRSWQRRVAAISFDDGFRSILTNALPVLSEFRVPATVFLNAAYVRQDYLCPVILSHYADRHGLRDELAERLPDIEPGQTIRIYVRRHAGWDLLQLLNETVAPKLDNRQLFLSRQDLNRMPADLIEYGNHTYHHLRLANLDRDTQHREIIRNDQQFADLAGYDPILCIPFGANDSFNDDTRDLLQTYGQSYLITAIGAANHREEGGLTVIERTGVSDNKPPLGQLLARRVRGKPDMPAYRRHGRAIARRLRNLV